MAKISKIQVGISGFAREEILGTDLIKYTNMRY